MPPVFCTVPSSCRQCGAFVDNVPGGVCASRSSARARTRAGGTGAGAGRRTRGTLDGEGSKVVCLAALSDLERVV